MSEPLSIEDQLAELKKENALLKTENHALQLAVKHAHNENWEANYYVQWYLHAKINRQAAALRRLQWHGWEPELIIQEEENIYDVIAA